MERSDLMIIIGPATSVLHILLADDAMVLV
jgi:hypothetical protein